MAFAPLRQEAIPFSDIAHIDPFTMAYVLSLREKEGQDDFHKNLSEEDRKLLEAENAPLRKGKLSETPFCYTFCPLLCLDFALNSSIIGAAKYNIYRSSKVQEEGMRRG